MPSPATLVGLESVKKQLRISSYEQDDEVSDLLNDAEDIVTRFMGDRFDAEWTDQTVPGAVRAAILKQVAYLWAHRGDAALPEPDESGLAPGVRWLLQANGFRDLTIG